MALHSSFVAKNNYSYEEKNWIISDFKICLFSFSSSKGDINSALLISIYQIDLSWKSDVIEHFQENACITLVRKNKRIEI